MPQSRRCSSGTARRALALVATLCLGVILPPTLAAQAAGAPVWSGCEIDYPPYCFIDGDGQADGFAVELLRASLAAVGREVTFRTGSWPRIKQDLIEGRLEALPLVARTPEREALFEFTFPYLTMHGTIIVRDDTTDIHGPSDLRGKHVAVLQGDYAAEFLEGARLGAIVEPLLSFETALRELSSGTHDAVVIQKLLAYQLMQKAGLKNLRSVGPPLEGYSQVFCFAARKDDDALLSALNEGLSIVMADGTYRRLYARWFSEVEALGLTKSRIVVGGDSNYPPYEYLDANGEPAGFTVELTRSIARRMGLSVEIRLGPWSTIRRGLETGDIDMVEGMFYSAGRDQRLIFSPAHAVIQHVIVTRTGSPDLPDLAALEGKSVLVMDGDIMQDLAVARGYADHLVAVASEEEALRRLASGQGDCALVSKLPALYWIRKRGWKNLRVPDNPVASPEYCYAVSRGGEDLLAAFTEGIAALREGGDYRALQARWLAPYQAVKPGFWTIVKYSLFGILPLVALLGVFLVWTYALRRAVALRTRELSDALADGQRTAEELRATAGRLSLARSAAQIGIWDLDLTSNRLSWDERMCELYGVDPARFDPTFEAWLGSVHPEDRKAADEVSRDARNGGREYHTGFRILRPDGEVRYIQADAAFQRSLDGQPSRMIGVNIDVTERTASEVALRSANERLSHEVAQRRLAEAGLRQERDFAERLLQTAHTIVLVLDMQGRIVRFNRYMEELSGVRLEEVRGSDWFSTFLPRRDRDRIRALFICAEQGTPTRGNVNAIVTRDGREIEIEWYDSVLRDPDGTAIGVLSTGQDITARREAEEERLRLEAQVQHAQKLESLGVLAGGIAHDFNNLLMAILGNAELARNRLPAASPARGQIEQIETATLRAATLAGQMLAYSGRGAFQFGRVDLGETVEAVIRMVESSIPKMVRLEKRLPRGRCLVRADSGQMQQVAVNVITNATEAIGPDNAGTVVVETGVRACGEDYLRQSRLPEKRPAGSYAYLQVTDDGCGMDEQTMARLFDPFYTTKFTGRGLGLSAVLGIVRGHGGAILVESRPGAGSTFTVLLPALEPAQTAAAGRGEAPGLREARGRGPGDGHGTVLVAEDDEEVLGIVRVMLEGLGYTVITAVDGKEAVETFRERAGEICLVLLDLTMPLMSGEEAFAEIHRLDPRAPVLLSSGYSEQAIRERCGGKGIVGFIQKPYRRRDLEAAVAAALGPWVPA